MKKIILIVCSIAGIVVIIHGYNNYKKSQASKNWPSTEGIIISSEVKQTKHRKSGSSSGYRYKYSPKVKFEYYVDDETYTSRRISFADYSSSNRSSAKQIADYYHPEKEVTVYYDPLEPKVGVLEPGTANMSTIIVGGVIILFGIIGAFHKKDN